MSNDEKKVDTMNSSAEGTKVETNGKSEGALARVAGDGLAEKPPETVAEEKPVVTHVSAEREAMPSAEHYTTRDIVFFDPHTMEPGTRHTISLVPRDDEPVLLGRVFFHKTLAENLIVERFSVGERTIAKGSGTGEIFLATIPNWTPQDVFFSKTEPLLIIVRNVRHFDIRVAGSAVYFRKSSR